MHGAGAAEKCKIAAPTFVPTIAVLLFGPERVSFVNTKYKIFFIPITRLETILTIAGVPLVISSTHAEDCTESMEISTPDPIKDFYLCKKVGMKFAEFFSENEKDPDKLVYRPYYDGEFEEDAQTSEFDRPMARPLGA